MMGNMFSDAVQRQVMQSIADNAANLSADTLRAFMNQAAKHVPLSLLEEMQEIIGRELMERSGRNLRA